MSDASIKEVRHGWCKKKHKWWHEWMNERSNKIWVVGEVGSVVLEKKIWLLVLEHELKNDSWMIGLVSTLQTTK